MLIQIWLFEHEFESRILANFEFLGYEIWQQTVQKFSRFHLHFQLKSNRKGKTGYIDKELIQKSENNYQRTKIDQ